MTTDVAFRLSRALDTTPELRLNLLRYYDNSCSAKHKEAIIVNSREFFPYTFLEENKPFKHMQEVAFTYEDIIWTNTTAGIEAEDNWKAPKA